MQNRPWSFLLIMVLLSACGRVGYDASSPPDVLDDDASSPSDILDVDASSPPDMLNVGSLGIAPDASVAWSVGPFGPARPIDVLSSPERDDDPTVTADLLELYFNTDRFSGSAAGDIMVSTRSDPSEPWGVPTLVSELSLAAADDESPEVAPDGLTIWFARYQGESYDIWTSTRDSRSEPWGPPARDALLSSPDRDEVSACPSWDLRQMVVSLAVSRPVFVRDLLLSTRSTTASPWSTPRPIAELNTSSDEAAGFVDITGTTVWFSTDRDGADDILVAGRPNRAAPFESPSHAEGLNTAANESDPWVSVDGSYVVFSSDRSGNEEIYEARRE